MKLLVGKVLMETDHIEVVEQLSPHTVRVYFVSGQTCEVVCGIKTTGPAFWEQDVEGFMQTIQNTDYVKLAKPGHEEKTKSK